MDTLTEKEREEFYRQRDKDFRALPFIRNISKEERKELRAQLDARHFHRCCPQGRIYWTVDVRAEDGGDPTASPLYYDREMGREWAEKMLDYIRKYDTPWFLVQIIEHMLMRGRFGFVESGFIDAISRHLVDEYKKYVKPAMEREQKEMDALVVAVRDQLDREREEATRREDREKRKALFTVVK